MDCILKTGCHFNDRVVAADALGNIKFVLPDPYAADPLINWKVNLSYSAGGIPLGASIINKGTGTALHVPDNGQYNRVDTVPANQLDGWSIWTFASNFDDNNKDPGAVAVRPLANADLNLNVRGGCGGSEICVWKWGGSGDGTGSQNEKWYVRYSPQGGSGKGTNSGALFCRIMSACGRYLTHDASRPGIYLAPARSFDRGWGSQLWQPNLNFGQHGAVTGWALSQYETGHRLAITHDDPWLGVADSSTSPNFTGWTFAAHDSSWVAIRPYFNVNQNLNVKYGCSNDQVMLYGGWDGGQPNELWHFEIPSTQPVQMNE